MEAQRITCDECELTYKTKATLRIHVTRKHNSKVVEVQKVHDEDFPEDEDLMEEVMDDLDLYEAVEITPMVLPTLATTTSTSPISSKS